MWRWSCCLLQPVYHFYKNTIRKKYQGSKLSKLRNRLKKTFRLWGYVATNLVPNYHHKMPLKMLAPSMFINSKMYHMWGYHVQTSMKIRKIFQSPVLDIQKSLKTINFLLIYIQGFHEKQRILKLQKSLSHLQLG